MESFLIKAANNRRGAITTTQPSYRLSLPGYTKLVDELRTGRCPHYSIPAKQLEKQIHMVWTKTGILFYTPTSEDYTYRSEESFQTDAKPNVDTSGPRPEPRRIGHFEYEQEIQWHKGAHDMLSLLLEDVTKFLDAVDFTFRRETGVNIGHLRDVLNSDSSDINRQLRFIATGALLNGVKLPIELFQYLVSSRITSEVICEGQMYRTSDAEIYDTLPQNKTYMTTQVKKYEMLLAVRRYGMKARAMELLGGNSLMLSRGGQPRSQREKLDWGEDASLTREPKDFTIALTTKHQGSNAAVKDISQKPSSSNINKLNQLPQRMKPIKPIIREDSEEEEIDDSLF
jgi:hypothetical protein